MQCNWGKSSSCEDEVSSSILLPSGRQSTFCKPPDTMEKDTDGFGEPSTSFQWRLDSEKIEVER